MTSPEKSGEPRMEFLLRPWHNTLLPLKTFTLTMNSENSFLSKGQKTLEGHLGATKTPLALQTRKWCKVFPIAFTGGTNKTFSPDQL